MAEAVAEALRRPRHRPRRGLPAGARAGDRRRRSPRRTASTIAHRRPADRGGQPLRGPGRSAWATARCSTRSTGAPAQPVQAVVGRAVRRRSSGGCWARWPTPRRRARSATGQAEAVLVSHQLPIWIARSGVEGTPALARPAQAPVHAGLGHVVHVRRRRRDRRGHLHRAGQALLPVDVGGAEVLGRRLNPSARRPSHDSMPMRTRASLRPAAPRRSPPRRWPASRCSAGARRTPPASRSTPAGNDQGYVAGDGRVTVVPAAEREDAPELSGPTLDGGTWSLADQRARSSCSTCGARGARRAARRCPTCSGCRERYADQGVAFVGLDTRDTDAAAQAFIENIGVTYPQRRRPRRPAAAGVPRHAAAAGDPDARWSSTGEGRIAARIIGPITEPRAGRAASTTCWRA